MPYLKGERAPIFDPDARGCFFGVETGDEDLLEGKEFPITTLKAIHKFEEFLTRKLYTYNAASCIIAYLGWKKVILFIVKQPMIQKS